MATQKKQPLTPEQQAEILKALPVGMVRDEAIKRLGLPDLYQTYVVTVEINAPVGALTSTIRNGIRDTIKGNFPYGYRARVDVRTPKVSETGEPVDMNIKRAADRKLRAEAKAKKASKPVKKTAKRTIKNPMTWS